MLGTYSAATNSPTAAVSRSMLRLYRRRARPKKHFYFTHTHPNYMKKAFLHLLFMFAIFPPMLWAQCENNNDFFAHIPLQNGGSQSLQLHQGEYVTLNVVQGQFYRISTCGGSNFTTRLTLYNGGGSTRLADNYSGCSNGSNGALIYWRATFTGTLRILLDHRKCTHHTKDGEQSNDDFDPTRTATLLIEHIPPPPNDLCENATPLFTGANCAPSFGTLLAANIERSACVNYAYGDVWYSFTATHVNMEIAVDASGNFNPAIELYSGGDCNSLQPLRCDNSQTGSSELLASGGLTVGRRYYLRVFHRASSSAANGSSSSNDAYPDDPSFRVCIVDIPPPANDDCANATTLTHHWRTQCGAISGTTRGATPSSTAALPLPACTGEADDDIWYVFEARHTEAFITVEGLRDFAFQVFADDCATSYVCQNSSSSSIGGTESLRLTGLQLGTRYRIRVYTSDRLDPSGEDFAICVTVPPPSNDACANAIELTQQPAYVYHTGSVLGATPSNPTIAAAQCSGDGDDDVWFSFRPSSANARLRLQTFDDFDGVAQVMFDCRQYSRDCINDIDGSGIEERLLTNLTVGREYFVRVYSYGSTRPQSSSFNIALTDELPTNVEEIAIEEDNAAHWRLFPNPTSDVLRLLHLESGTEGEAKWAIRDMLGRSLQQGSVYTHTGSQEWTFNVQNLPAGVYWLEWQHTQTGERQAWNWIKQ